MNEQKPQRRRLYTEMFGEQEIVTKANFSYLAYSFGLAAISRREKLAQFLKTLEHDLREIIATLGYLGPTEMDSLEIDFHRETRDQPLTLVIAAENADLRYNNLPVVAANLIEDLQQTASKIDCDPYLLPTFCSIGHRHIVQVNSPWALILLLEDYIETRTPYITIDALEPSYAPRRQDGLADAPALLDEFSFRMLGAHNLTSHHALEAHDRAVKTNDRTMLLPVSFMRLRHLLDSTTPKTIFDTNEPESHTYALH